ncbi:MAG: hypothetical protein HYS13_02090 [Planctomycetia bacterium]|nr:hypothetical protein [Planctomycetia bacterium]
MRILTTALLAFAIALFQLPVPAAEPGRTTLTNPDIKYTVPAKHYAVLKRGDVEAIVVDNEAVNDEVLKDHKAGYSGVAVLTHTKRRENLFVPNYAGLNYEHIHDGTTCERDILFEPRKAPMQLRVVGEHAVELHQPPTPNWGLESSLRYELLSDGAIEMTIECIPRRKAFKNGYVALFWASYIHQPESLDIHFRGGQEGRKETTWVRGVTPAHGVLSNHRATDDNRELKHDSDFPLTLVYNDSKHRYHEPWYFGVSHGMAYAQVFRTRDRVRLTQSPSGGGRGNPAWDFQCFFENYEVDRAYQLVMRAVYVPFESPEQVAKAVKLHLQALNPRE